MGYQSYAFSDHFESKSHLIVKDVMVTVMDLKHEEVSTVSHEFAQT